VAGAVPGSVGRQLAVLMMDFSDNYAAKLLIDLVGMENVQKRCAPGIEGHSPQAPDDGPRGGARRARERHDPARNGHSPRRLYGGEI